MWRGAGYRMRWIVLTQCLRVSTAAVNHTSCGSDVFEAPRSSLGA